MRRVRNTAATHRQEECPLCRQRIMPGELVANYEATAVGEDVRFTNHDHAACADLHEIEADEERYLDLDEMPAADRQAYLRKNRDLQREPQLR